MNGKPGVLATTERNDSGYGFGMSQVWGKTMTTIRARNVAATGKREEAAQLELKIQTEKGKRFYTESASVLLSESNAVDLAKAIAGDALVARATVERLAEAADLFLTKVDDGVTSWQEAENLRAALTAFRGDA